MASPTAFHDYKCVVTDIDRMKDGKRIVPMKVLVLGMPRTGTESTTTALRLLGINQLYHGFQALFDNPRDNKYWHEAIEAKFDGKGKPYGRAEFDRLLGHCQGVSDQPAILFAKELIEAYPEAKVILTNRSFDSWYPSCRDTCYALSLHPVSKIINPIIIPLTFLLRMPSRYTRPCWIRTWQQLNNFTPFTEKNARKTYDQHYALVRDIVAQQPKDQNNSKLLEYDVKEGWGPLCKFLGIDVPETPFPRGNEKDIFNKRFEKAPLIDLLEITKRLILVVIVIGALIVLALPRLRTRIWRSACL